MLSRADSFSKLVVCAAFLTVAIGVATFVEVRGQQVEVAPRALSVVLRSVRDEKGAAIDARDLRVAWGTPKDRAWLTAVASGDDHGVRSDASGAIVIDVPPQSSSAPEIAPHWPPSSDDVLVLNIGTPATAKSPARETSCAFLRAPLRAETAAKPCDIGELVLRASPPIAVGFAVALESASERVNARISLVEKLATWAEDATEPVLTWCTVPGSITTPYGARLDHDAFVPGRDEPGAPSTRSSWSSLAPYTLHNHLAHNAVEKKSDGSYVMATRYVLAEAEGRAPVLAAIDPTQPGPLVLALPKMIGAHGMLVVDPDIDPLIFDIELEYHRSTPLAQWLDIQPRAGRGVGVGFAAIDEHGAFSWTALAPGIVDIRVRIAGSTQILFEAGFSEIDAEHQDLGQIDLRGRVPTWR